MIDRQTADRYEVGPTLIGLVSREMLLMAAPDSLSEKRSMNALEAAWSPPSIQ